MLKRWKTKWSNNCKKYIYIKVIVWRKVHFQDIKWALQRSLNHKKTDENITKLRIQSRRKAFRTCLHGMNVKQVITKQSLLTSAQIFEKVGSEGVKGKSYW